MRVLVLPVHRWLGLVRVARRHPELLALSQLAPEVMVVGAAVQVLAVVEPPGATVQVRVAAVDAVRRRPPVKVEGWGCWWRPDLRWKVKAPPLEPTRTRLWMPEGRCLPARMLV